MGAILCILEQIAEELANGICRAAQVRVWRTPGDVLPFLLPEIGAHDAGQKEDGDNARFGQDDLFTLIFRRRQCHRSKLITVVVDDAAVE
ncbi:hypothetical protein ACTMU2_37715 [Cupriavidus basilensis]